MPVAPPLEPPLHLPHERAHAPFSQSCEHQPYSTACAQVSPFGGGVSAQLLVLPPLLVIEPPAPLVAPLPEPPLVVVVAPPFMLELPPIELTLPPLLGPEPPLPTLPPSVPLEPLADEVPPLLVGAEPPTELPEPPNVPGTPPVEFGSASSRAPLAHAVTIAAAAPVQMVRIVALSARRWLIPFGVSSRNVAGEPRSARICSEFPDIQQIFSPIAP